MFQKLKTVFPNQMTFSAVFLFSFLLFFFTSCEREVVENCSTENKNSATKPNQNPNSQKSRGRTDYHLPYYKEVNSVKGVMVEISGFRDLAITENEILFFDEDRAVDDFYQSVGGTYEEQYLAKQEVVRLQKDIFLYGGRLQECQIGDVLLSPVSDSIPPKTCWLFYSTKSEDSLVTVCMDLSIAVQKFIEGSGRSFDMLSENGLAISNLSVSISGDHIQSSDPLHMVRITERGPEEIFFKPNAGKQESLLVDSLTALVQESIKTAEMENLCYKLGKGNYEFSVSGMYENMPFRKNFGFTIQ